MLKVQDTGELVYGGLVMGAQWWDEKRISEGKLLAKDVWKKYSTWSYLGIGLIATLMGVFGWMRRYESWTEKISTGFIFYLPIFARDVITNMSTTTAGRGTNSAAVAEANRILAAKKAAALNAGRVTDRTYQPEFDQAMVV
jgi:hypothetical protein